MDDDGNRTLNFEEFKKGIQESGTEFSEEECRDLFTKFDTDNSGSIDVEEFLRAVRVRNEMS